MATTTELSKLHKLTKSEIGAISGIYYMLSLSHGVSQDCGWYKDPTTGAPVKRNVPEMIALIHSEISEALEGFRKDKKDNHITDMMSVEVELADALHRIFDLAEYIRKEFPEYKDMDIAKAYTLKARFNRIRADHKPENRSATGGKKF